MIKWHASNLRLGGINHAPFSCEIQCGASVGAPTPFRRTPVRRPRGYHHAAIPNTHACLSSHETLRCAQLAQCPAWADAAGGREPSRVARQERSGRAEVGYGDPRTGVIDALTGGDTPLLPSVLLATGTLRQLPMLVLLGDAAAICRREFPPFPAAPAQEDVPMPSFFFPAVD